MADVSLDQRIIEKLHQLDDATKRRVLDFIERAAEARDAEWEERVVSEALGDALRPDGSLDFDRLRQTGVVMTPEELYPEGDESDAPAPPA